MTAVVPACQGQMAGMLGSRGPAALDLHLRASFLCLPVERTAPPQHRSERPPCSYSCPAMTKFSSGGILHLQTCLNSDLLYSVAFPANSKVPRRHSFRWSCFLPLFEISILHPSFLIRLQLVAQGDRNSEHRHNIRCPPSYLLNFERHQL